MFLIADSGSTKCNWILIDSEGVSQTEFSTIGLNPYFHSTEKVKAELWESDEALKIKDSVEQVYFYGAGCSSERLVKIVEDGLIDFFRNASVIVDHDLVASAYSAYAGNPVITCILGTGSNSSFFDGEKIFDEIPSLAYILGDEGSGSYFAKILVREFYYKRLPDDIWQAFNSEFRLSDKDIIRKVYSEPNPNVFLANFMPFIAKFKDHPHVKNWMVNGFREFIDIHVKCYSNWREVEVSFIGSVAFHFEDYLKEACVAEELNLGTIVAKPIESLVRYHVDYIIPNLTN